jgi:hypothetical protein
VEEGRGRGGHSFVGVAARSVPAGGSGGGEAAPWLGAERFGGDS